MAIVPGSAPGDEHDTESDEEDQEFKVEEPVEANVPRNGDGHWAEHGGDGYRNDREGEDGGELDRRPRG